MNLIEIKNASKIYKTGTIETIALNQVSLQIAAQEFTVLAGPSGSGKTTLLNLMGGLDQPTHGEVYFDGHPMHTLKQKELTQIRLTKIGFVFQAYNLIPVLTALENVEYIMLLQKRDAKERRAKALQILEEVGLKDYVHRRPTEMSGGQQQRVAVARAIVSEPKLILADEPTANLDSTTANKLLDLMQHMNEKHGITFVFSTHDQKIIDRAKRIVRLEDGKIVSQ
jgi:putative ABC transport system ATP-binding protein